MNLTPRPLLIYDGDCGFCGYWAWYWQALTGDRVEYRPYQEVGAQFPEISSGEFRRAVQFIANDGTRAQGAEASFLTLSHAPGKGVWLWLYRRMPGFAAVSELAYRFIAAHRPAFFRISLALWGRDYRPPRHDLVSFLFLRLFGLIYLAAFVSFAVQAQGLIGSDGILPLREFVDGVTARFGAERFLVAPMVFWIDDGDTAIAVVCWAGVALSVLLTINLLPRLSLFLLYVLYLSLLYAGQSFMTYQWDTFLLETGVMALVLSVAKGPGVWLLRWLLFRFMFMSGVVKLASGDPNWWNLTALSYHFLTQPLPTPVAWYAARLSPTLLQIATGATFAVELVVPFLIFCPRRMRFVAAIAILLLQGCISLTGNYNWFNLQTMLLCLALFDDAALGKILPASLVRRLPVRRDVSGMRWIVNAFAVLVVFQGLVEMDERFGGDPPALAAAVDAAVEPLHLVSAYGLFAVMTTERHEIVIEGSMDGETWRDYAFKYKPGDVMRAPRWNIPHQPRLDWQMWFAALDDPRRLPWFPRFLARLLANDRDVTALLATNPFPDTPPRYVRAEFFDYTYAGADEKEKGIWWDRRLLGLYFPPAQLKPP
jgi:predicted DCC family thiol-disulfide oxidoreductase YuxK